MPRKYAIRLRTCLLRRIGKDRGLVEVGEEDEAVLQRVVSRQLESHDMLVNEKEEMRRKASGCFFFVLVSNDQKLGARTPGGERVRTRKVVLILARDHCLRLYRYGACIHARSTGLRLSMLD